MSWPQTIRDIDQLNELLSRPSPQLVEFFRHLDGDILILGAGGKMGPSLAEMALRASSEAGKQRVVYAVSRFSDADVRTYLDRRGIRTLRGDLLDREFVAALPEVENVVFMVGRKFGTTENRSLTWALNAFLPGLVAERFRDSRIVCFSTGNVYPLVPVTSGGATEETPPQPVGEYAQSALARERIFEYFSVRHETPVTIIRLNYAVEMRYGVIVDVAQKVLRGDPVPVAMPVANVIWQGDANDYTLRSFALASSPPTVLNVTGPETVSVRWLALELARLMDLPHEPQFVGEEAATALLSNASRCFQLFGYPRVTLGTVLRWTAHWVQSGGPIHGKPTHFETRDGQF